MRESVDHFGKSNTFGGSYIRAKRAESLQASASRVRVGLGLIWLALVVLGFFCSCGWCAWLAVFT